MILDDPKYYLPAKLKEAPLGDYYIGCDYCTVYKSLSIAVFNKDDNTFYYVGSTEVENKDKALEIATLAAQYVNATLLFESN